MAVITAGCGNSGFNSATVAAKVNGDSIAVSQIGAVIGRGAAAPPEQLKQAGAGALENLIDQQLLAQKAVEQKLDRDPRTAAALENARNQVLAQAYMDKTLVAAGKPATQEIREFYDKNPLLFSQRRIYRFQELGAVVPDDKFPVVNGVAQKAKKLDEVAAWLKANEIPFKAIDSTKSAEEIPLDLLPNLARLNDGQIAVLRAPGRVAILQLVQSQQAPLDIQHATTQIEQFLTNGRRMEIGKAEVKKLRDAAKIEYLGEYANSKPSAVESTASAK